MTTLYSGETHSIVATFRDDEGVIGDPLSVEAYVMSPAKTSFGPYVYGVGSVITRATAGIYSLSWVLDMPGTWQVWFGYRNGPDLVKIEPLPLNVVRSPWT